MGGVSTPSHWTITGPVSLDLQPSSSGHQGLTDLQPSSTGAASLPSLDFPPPPSVSVELGSTQLEVAAADDVEILQRYAAVAPLLVDAGALGSFAERESARCLASAEPYEAVLVRICVEISQ